jgi:hypothetical protein
MQAYTVHLRTGTDNTAIQPRTLISRRPSIDMPFSEPRAVAVGQNGGDAPASTPPVLPGEFDLNLDLEVPAFLRRNDG